MAIRVYRSLRLRLAFPGFRLRLQKKKTEKQKKTFAQTFHSINPESSFISWSQSYDRELQRQRCRFLQRHG
jgi:hypothetical protein